MCPGSVVTAYFFPSPLGTGCGSPRCLCPVPAHRAHSPVASHPCRVGAGSEPSRGSLSHRTGSTTPTQGRMRRCQTAAGSLCRSIGGLGGYSQKQATPCRRMLASGKRRARGYCCDSKRALTYSRWASSSLPERGRRVKCYPNYWLLSVAFLILISSIVHSEQR